MGFVVEGLESESEIWCDTILQLQCLLIGQAVRSRQDPDSLETPSPES